MNHQIINIQEKDLRKIINKLIGASAETPLRHKMTNTALLINMFYGIISIITNFFIKLPLITTVVLAVTVLLFSILYFLSRFKGKAELSVDIAVSFTFFVFTPVMWFTNNGLEGGFHLFIFLFGAFTLAVLEGKKLLLFLLSLFIISIALIITERLHPEWITQYPSETEKFTDLFISFILVFIGIIFLMYVYTKQFYKYNQKLNESNIELEQVNIELSGRIKEREVLLHEVHHRVKNNLQMVSGLLSLQSNTAKDQKLSKLLKTSQERINAISGVHELLYRSNNLKFIDINEYTEDLVKNIKVSSYTDKRNIIIQTDLQSSIIEIKKIIPYGLIINELLSNSIKHAFNDMGGLIKIEGRKTDHEYIIKLSDNGKGLPLDFDIENLDSLGFKLLKGLIEQINGEFNYKRPERGIEFIVKFTVN